MLDVSRKHFLPGGTLVISVPNRSTHVKRRFPSIDQAQENWDSHDQTAKLVHLQTQWPIITSTPGLTRNITLLYKDLDTGFTWFPRVFKRMLRWFPTFQVATTCFSCSPPDVNLVAKQCHILYTCQITTATG